MKLLASMETKHWAVIGGMLVAIGMQLSGTEHGWHDVLTPQFIGGAIVSVGTTVAAMAMDKPKQTP